MPRYTFDVVETLAVACRYTIVADSETDARELAANGDTVEETHHKTRGVIDRVVEELIEVTPDDHIQETG